MKIIISFVFLIYPIFCANLPTITVTRRSTVRFPNEETFSTQTTVIDISPISATTQRTKIKPSKITEGVQVVGNYSSASVQKQTNSVDEIIEKYGVLAVLNLLRQLPREKLGQILSDGNGSLPSVTSESPLEVLKPQTTTASTTTEETSEENLTEAFEYVEETTLLSINDDYVDFTEQPEQNEFVPDEDLPSISDTQIIHPPPLISEKPSNLTETYEFTDYPPPLPPPITEYNYQGNTDTSFAVGVAVGILACVVVAATGVTWCICRRHWGRRNVYATMEADEIPRAFTKPGPPIILPDEFTQASNKVLDKDAANNAVSNCVTEL